MGSYTYLKDEIHYIELYDKHTIEECLWWENYDTKKTVGKNIKKSEKAENERRREKALVEFSLFFIKGERYRNKSETIREWMQKDQAKDKHVSLAIPPTGIRCLGCSSIMDCTNRDLMNDHSDNEEWVVFMFQCSRCQKRRAYWENGQEWEIRPTPCPKCQTSMQSSNVRQGNVVTTTYICPNCGYTETSKLDFDERFEETIDPHHESNRKKYCLSDKVGGEYISSVNGVKELVDKFKDREENKEAYEAVAKIKKLAIADLQGLLITIVEKAGYVKFELGKPEIRQGVRIDFSLQDNQPGRSEYDSTNGLTKLFKKALQGTNWRLMSDGVRYQLGFLNGRLRGVEGEEELLELAKRDLGKK